MSELVNQTAMSMTFKSGSSVLMTSLDSKSRGPVSVVETKTGSERYSPWGDDNLFPQSVIDRIAKVTLVSSILDWKARALYGGGLAYGLLSIDETTGQEKFTELYDSEIHEWMDQTDIAQYLMEASSYFYHFYNIFPEITLSAGGNRVNFLTCKESTDCRWSLRSQKDTYKGLIEECFISPDWSLYDDKAPETATLKVVQTQRDPVGFLKAHKNVGLIYPISFPSPGRAYYQAAPWHVLFDTWLPIAEEIPKFKKALLKNQLTIKYIIKVPEWWWSWKYKDWGSKTEADRIKIIQAEHESFDTFFSAERQGKSIMYTQLDSVSNKTYGAWEIQVIDDKMKQGMYIEDSQEADAHIFKNLQVDPTLFGAGAGKNNTSSGSGSDKRVAWNNYMIQVKAHQDLILKPLSLIATFNGWRKRLEKDGQRLTFWLRNYQIARLDSGSETKAV